MNLNKGPHFDGPMSTYDSFCFCLYLVSKDADTKPTDPHIWTIMMTASSYLDDHECMEGFKRVDKWLEEEKDD